MAETPKPPPPDEITLTGTLYAGRFDVVDRLGEGAMGTVYRARHIQSGEWVALKRLHPEYVNDDEVVARFNREMDATARVAHPNTARVIDYGADDGYLYLAMEIIEGRSLDDVIVDDCPMPADRVAHIGKQIADALAAAHAAQIVHRDLKPENIMLVDRAGDPDFVKVLDFGLAAFMDEEKEARLTGHGLRVGTPLFMAPEYIAGDQTDHRADLYGLGVVLYLLAVGRAPFIGSPYSILHKAVAEDVVPPSEASPTGCAPWLESIILRLMDKNPDNRIQTADEVSRLLAEGREVTVHPPTPRDGPASSPPTSATTPRQAAGPAFIGAAAIALLVAGFAIGWLMLG